MDFDENFKKRQKCNEEQLIRFWQRSMVCLSSLLVYYSKTYEWISMKFSGLIEDGTSNMPLKFGSDLWPLQRFVFVCLFINMVTQKVINGYQWNFQERLIMVQVTSHYTFGSKLLPCRRFALPECTLRVKICALWVLLVVVFIIRWQFLKKGKFSFAYQCSVFPEC